MRQSIENEQLNTASASPQGANETDGKARIIGGFVSLAVAGYLWYLHGSVDGGWATADTVGIITFTIGAFGIWLGDDSDPSQYKGWMTEDPDSDRVQNSNNGAPYH